MVLTHVVPSSIFTLCLWDKVGVQLCDLAATGHDRHCRGIFGALEKQEQSQAVSSADAAGPCPALTLRARLTLALLMLQSGRSHHPLCPAKGGEGILSHGPEQPIHQI